MLTSQAWRRLAHKTSTLGLASTLIAFVGSIFIISTPTAALADVTKQFSYSCGTMLASSAQTINVGLSAPNSVTAGSTFNLTVSIPQLTLATAPTQATTLQVNATLVPNPGSIQDPGVKTGASVTANNVTVPTKEVVYRVTVPAGTTSKVSVDPGNLVLSLAQPSTTTTTCTTTSTEVLDVPIGTGGGGNNDDDVITYRCNLSPENASDPDNDYPAEQVDIKVELTMPTNATANADASITWRSTIQAGSDPLPVPTGFPTSTAKVIAALKTSGAGTPANGVTGEVTFTGLTVGNNITTIPQVTVKVRPTSTGTVTVTPGDLVFGAAAAGTTSAPAIKCVAPTTGLKTYTFQVAAATSSPSATNTSPTATRTSTATVTVTPSSRQTSQTPKAGADTGGGGMMGPDGRMFLLTGTVLIGAAAAGGLILRRRSIRG